MAEKIHSGLRAWSPVIEVLVAASREAVARTATKTLRAPSGAFCSLKPGPDSPLWNELRRRVASQLNRHGQKVLLARYLGISRQRLHLLVKAGSAMPDAERTLLLLAWLVSREKGTPRC